MSCTHKDNCELDTRAYARRLSQGQKQREKKKKVGEKGKP